MDLLTWTVNFNFGRIALSCFFLNFPGWAVGKSDFNENPVVSPDLDFCATGLNSDKEKSDVSGDSDYSQDPRF